MEEMEINEMEIKETETREMKTKEKKARKKKMGARMLAGALSFVMAAGLIFIPERNAATADAAANKGAVIYADLDEVTWDDDWSKKENNRVSLNEWGAENVTLSADTTMSFKIYMPKTIFGKKKNDKESNDAVDLYFAVNLHDENWEWMGQLHSTASLSIERDADGNFSLYAISIADDINQLWDTAEPVDTSWASVDEKGDFYLLTVDGYPLGDSMTVWNEEADKDELVKLDTSRTYNFNESFDLRPNNGTGGEGVFIFDDIVVKNSSGEIVSQNFESSDEVADKYVPGDNDENRPTLKGESYTTSLLSLKSNKASLKVGKKAKIKATAFNGAEVTYKSNKPKVASVDKKGNVKALKKGKAVISVSCCGKTLKYTVKVSK